MFNLDNIRVIDYLQLPEESLEAYGRLQKIMKPIDKFCGKKATPLGRLTFGQVTEMKSMAGDPTLENLVEMFNLAFGVSKHQILRAWVIDFFPAANWITKSLAKIVSNEIEVLSGDVDPLLIEAGIERLNRLQELPTLYEIGEKFGKDPEEIENWKYNKVFAIQAYTTISNQVSKEYQKLKSKSA